MRLKDLSIAITGSGRGIGRAIAICCADEGARIVLNDISSSSLQEACSILESKKAQFIAVEGDISKRSEAQRLIEATVKEFGQIDVLVNNAGIAKAVRFVDLTEEDWDNTIRVNLKGVFNCSQFAARYMIQHRSGRIINISSRAYLGAMHMAHYAATKAGILGMTRCLAMELGPYGITVNAVAPGMIDTEMARSLGLPNFRERQIKKTPLRKIGTPEEVGHAVVFLASPEAGFITGEVLHVTGGVY